MRLGGPVFAHYDTPEEWVRAVRDKGYGAALCPVKAGAPMEEIQAYKDAAHEADIVIAEVGAWSNPIHPDPREKEKAVAHCIEHLRLADAVGANCCVNIAGSRDAEMWDGPHPDNFTEETFAEIVEGVRTIIDAVRPGRTFYALEPMPWVFPDTADNYLELLRAVDRDRFGVHIDMVNVIRTPRDYYRSADVIAEWFGKLGPYIRSCHVKDTALEARFTSHLSESPPGEGGLCYGAYLRAIEDISTDMPLIMEHLDTGAEYDAPAAYIRACAQREGITIKW